MTADTPYLLKSGQTFSGKLAASDALRTALVESDQYARFHGNPNAQWSQDGLPQQLTLRNAHLDGRRSVEKGWLHPQSDPDVCDGVRLAAQGVKLDNVKVANFHGTGVRLWRGTNNKRNGPWQATDWESTLINWLQVHCCFSGLDVECGADGKCNYLEAAGIRDAGIHFGQRTGAWMVDKLHAFGCSLGLHSEGGAHLFGIVETETCGVGWRNEAPGTQVTALRAFNCWGTAAKLDSETLIGTALITATEGTALDIGPQANGTSLGMGVVNLSGQKPIGASIAADNCDLRMIVYGGQRPVVIPRAVVGLTLDLRLGPGADVGVEAPQGLGPGCKITIRHRNCRQPFAAGGFVPAGAIEVIAQ